MQLSPSSTPPRCYRSRLSTRSALGTCGSEGTATANVPLHESRTTRSPVLLKLDYWTMQTTNGATCSQPTMPIPKGKKQPITSTRLVPACQGRMENQMHLTIASESSLRQTLKDPAPPLYLLSQSEPYSVPFAAVVQPRVGPVPT